MCLINFSDPQIAEEDITVYKLVIFDGGEIVTFFRRVPICFNFLYESAISLSLWFRHRTAIEKALHSFTNLEEILTLCSEVNYKAGVVEATIPKGAAYYTGKTPIYHKDKEVNFDSIASDKIIYNKIIKQKEYEY